jgi:predicted GIY-YIG superfamily endonuclease
LEKSKAKQCIYIVQALLEPSKCKIGKTNDLERRLKEYNNITGVSNENKYKYLFTCEAKNMTRLENAIKEEFSIHREEKKKEIYFYNKDLFNIYVKFIKAHNLFVKEIFIKTENKKEIVKIVRKTTPALIERGVKMRDILQKAKKLKNDEFYTRYEDIEKEMGMYDKEIWKDKAVFCNCDDAVDNDERRTSAFSLYFLNNFKRLELKKLICTHYNGDVDLFNQGSKGYIFTKYGFKEIEQRKEYPKDYNGSFDHSLSVEILNKEADIVCTNPPFSRCIEYWELLINSKKKFIIMSSHMNPIYTAYIKYFREKKAWAGFHKVSKFLTPKREITGIPSFWYTNFKIKNRPKYKFLKFVKLDEIPEKYRIYDDNKTLLIDNCFIPTDYGKPFAISSYPILNGILEKGYEIKDDKEYTPYIKGKRCFKRVLIKKT